MPTPVWGCQTKTQVNMKEGKRATGARASGAREGTTPRPHLKLASACFLPHLQPMKRITLAALVLSLCSCQTTSFSPPVKDYAALAAADINKYTITDNNVYGLEPEGRLDPGLPIQGSRQDGSWTVYTVPDRKNGFDRAEVTVDAAGAIVRIQFFKTVHTAIGLRDLFDSTYGSLKSKYKVVQRLGDVDTADLTVYVAGDEAEWKQHYIQYLQLMDEPNNLGAQSCWILHPHLSLIQAVIRKQGAGGYLILDYQTRKYAAAMQAKAAPAPKSSTE